MERGISSFLLVIIIVTVFRLPSDAVKLLENSTSTENPAFNQTVATSLDKHKHSKVDVNKEDKLENKVKYFIEEEEITEHIEIEIIEVSKNVNESAVAVDIKQHDDIIKVSSSSLSFHSIFPAPMNLSDECTIYLKNVIVNISTEYVLTSPGTLSDDDMTGSGIESIIQLGTKCLQPKFTKELYIKKMEASLVALDFTLERRLVSFNHSNCANLIRDPSIHMIDGFFAFQDNKLYFKWFPYKGTCLANRCNVMHSLLEKCIEEISEIQNQLSKYTQTDKKPISVDDLKYMLLPTFTWSCPISIEHSLKRAMALESLHHQNKKLPKFCEKLMCNIKVYDFNLQKIIISMKNSEDYHRCSEYATRRSSFQGKVEIFSFDDKKNIIFLAGNYNKMDAEYAKLLTLFHYANDSQLRQCCNQLPNYQLYNTGKANYLYCYDNSDTCKNNTDLVIAEEVFENNYLVVLKDDVQSEIIQWLVTLNLEMSSPLYNYMKEIEYQYLTFANSKLFSFQIKDYNTNKFRTIITELTANNVTCIEKEYITTCNKYSVYLLFLKNCSLSFPDDDKSVFLLLNGYLKEEINIEYICQKNTAVVMDSVQERNIWDASSNTYYRPCLIGSLYYNMIGQGLMSHMCDTENIQVQENEPVFESYFNHQLNHFLIFPLQSKSSDASSSDFDLHKIITSNSTQDIMPMDGPFRGHPFSVSHFDINLIKLPFIIENTYINYNSKIRSMQEILRIFVTATFSNNSACQLGILDKTFTLKVEILPSTVQYSMGPISASLFENPCLIDLPPNVFRDSQENIQSNRVTLNIFWPCCSYNMLIFWNDDIYKVADWDYQPNICKAQEITLLVLNIFITISTVFGNIVLLFVFLTSGLFKTNQHKIYASTALGDLLLGAMPLFLSIIDQISLMNGSLTLLDFANSPKITLNQLLDYQHLKFERSGYPVVCAVVLNISVLVSILTLALLSIEQLLTLRKYSVKGTHLNLCIGFCWIIATCFSVTTNYLNGWSFTGHFNPVTKLTTNIRMIDETSVPSSLLYVQIAIGILVSALSIGIATFLLIRDQYYSYKHLENDNSKTDSTKENVNSIFYFILVVFMPVSVLLVTDVIVDFRNNNPILHYFSWWVFMVSISCKWIFYLCDKQVRKQCQDHFIQMYRKIKIPRSESQWNLEMK